MCLCETVLVLAGLFVVGECAAQHQEKEHLDKLQGKWKVCGSVTGGKHAPHVLLSLVNYNFENHKLIKHGGITSTHTWTQGDGWQHTFVVHNKKSEFQVQLDPKKTPHHIDLIENGKVAYHGIYCFEGDRLKICIGAFGRPWNFSGNSMFNALLVLRREDTQSTLH